MTLHGHRRPWSAAGNLVQQSIYGQQPIGNDHRSSNRPRAIIGIKQSNYNMSELVELLRLVGNKMAVTTGIDSQFYPRSASGGSIFSAAASVIPKQVVEVYDMSSRVNRTKL